MPRVCCWPIVLQNYFRNQNANIDSRHHSIGFNYRAFAAQHRVLQHNRPEGDICPFTVLHHRERASRPLLIAPGPADARTSISAMLFPNGSTRLASPTRSFCRCMATTSTMICAAAPRLPDAPPQNHGCDRLSARRLTRSSTVVAEMKGGRRCKTPSALGCRTCLFKAQCCPKAPFRTIPRSIYEEAREVARAQAKTEAFEQSRRERKRIHGPMRQNRASDSKRNAAIRAISITYADRWYCAMRGILTPRRRGVRMWIRAKKWTPLGEGYLLALVGCQWERQ